MRGCMETGIKSLYQKFELKDSKVVVRTLLDIEAIRSHGSGAIVIAIGNHC